MTQSTLPRLLRRNAEQMTARPAIRESFEESGLLLAHGEGGEPIAHVHAAELAQHRTAVAAGVLPAAD